MTPQPDGISGRGYPRCMRTSKMALRFIGEVILFWLSPSPTIMEVQLAENSAIFRQKLAYLPSKKTKPKRKQPEKLRRPGEAEAYVAVPVVRCAAAIVCAEEARYAVPATAAERASSFAVFL
jgi:hypothetical protein